MSVQAEKLLPFNHKSHVTKYEASDCELCHGYYDNGRFKGLPTVGDCKMCHDGNTAKEKAFLRASRTPTSLDLVGQATRSGVLQPHGVTKNTRRRVALVPCDKGIR
jgi:hypothetical protein